MANFLEWTKRAFFLKGREPKRSFSDLFSRFREILESNNRALDLMAEMGNKLGGDFIFDSQYIRSTCQEIADLVHKLIYNLNYIAPNKYNELNNAFGRINSQIEDIIAGKPIVPATGDCVIPHELITGDFEDIAGSKNTNAAELKNVLGLKVPDGFAVTTRAFQMFLSYNEIDEKIRDITEKWQNNELSTHGASSQITSLVSGGSISPQMKKEIQRALVELTRRSREKKLLLAIRSSALGEDGEYSFAGQYLSFLNEPPGNFFDCYKSVIASLYGETAMEYRAQAGFEEQGVAMAVVCMVMVKARASGVVYTMDPTNLEREMVAINAAWGLGAPVVAGEVKVDSFDVKREPPHKVMGVKIRQKTKILQGLADRGVESIPLEASLQTKACLTSEEATRLADYGLMIERYFKKPQDIEFSIDDHGTIWFLQARPLNIKDKMAKMVCDLTDIAKSYPIIFSERGVVAERGIATGKVFLYKEGASLDDFPHGAILVAEYTSPRFARIIKNAAGIITDVGSPTGHMATIAREFRVPTLVDTGIATTSLRNGQEITLDADENVVYDGSAKELCYYEFTDENFLDTHEFRLLKRVMKKISPLNFVDPKDKKFSPKYCKTFHDITRFVHEKAVEELINLNYYDLRKEESRALKLQLDIPLDMVLIDIGGGVDSATDKGSISPRDVISDPMGAFLKGLTTRGMWSRDPMSVDFGSFMSSLTRTFSSNLATPREIGQNLAVLSKEYVNISLRLGYHFNIIDAYMGHNPNDNYAYFRFFGGVTDEHRRSRRASFLSNVLSKGHFMVEKKGDLVVARAKKLSWERMEKRMILIGKLVAFTRQLDVKMVSDNHVLKYIDDFWKLEETSDL